MAHWEVFDTRKRLTLYRLAAAGSDRRWPNPTPGFLPCDDVKSGLGR